jgi:hypothetical protein
MLPVRKTHHLPIVFQPLDLHGVTKAVPTVVCPTRGEVLTVGTCGGCGEFRRIEFTYDGQPVVSCVTRATYEPPAPDDPDISEAQNVLRVPHVCAAPDTTISDVLPYVARRHAQEVIPVLDMCARPVGLAACEKIVHLFKHGADPQARLSSFMDVVFARVYPHTRLREAAAQRPEGAYRGVVVVGYDETFLGLVAASELPQAS